MADNQTTQQFAQQRYKEQRANNFYDMLSLNEGNVPNAYKDSKGIMHIGVGFNLEDGGNKNFLKKSGININDHSLTQAFKDAQSYDPNFAKRPEAVKMTLVDMAFNLGLTKLNKFVDMKSALMNNDYNKAADEMVASKWFDDVKSRGPRMVKVMRSAVK